MIDPSDCPKCGGGFREGYVADQTRMGAVASTWVEGAPVGLLADISRGGTERHQIRT